MKATLVLDSAATANELSSLLQVSATYGHRNLRGFKSLMDQLVIGAKQATPTTAVSATGTMTMTGAAVNNETFTLNGAVFTAKTAATLPNEFTLSATPTTQATNIVNAVNASTSVQVARIIKASNAAGVVTFTAIVPGTGGNAFTLVEALSNAVVSGAVLQGGVVNRPNSITIGAVAATATLTFTGAPTAAETFTINAVTFTARASGAAANEFNIGTSVTETAANVASMINASVTAKIVNVVTATSLAGVVTITAVGPGLGGNVFTTTEGLTNATTVSFAGGALTSITAFEI